MGSLWLQLAHFMVDARPLPRTRSITSPVYTPGMVMMQHDVITPNPDYKIPANLWDLNIAQCARVVTFIFSYRVPRSKGQLQASCLKIPSKISVKSFPGQNWVVVQVLNFWVLDSPWT